MIIAISAPAYKSGKDTVADLIEKYSDRKFERKKFADPLKNLVCTLIGCTREQLEDQSFKETQLGPEWDNMTVRDLLIKIGDGMRNITTPRVWVNALANEYTPDKDWIITDWRYESGEAEWLESQDAYTIRVIRPGIPLIDSPSERSLDNYNKYKEVIINDGTLEELEETIKEILNES